MQPTARASIFNYPSKASKNSPYEMIPETPRNESSQTPGPPSPSTLGVGGAQGSLRVPKQSPHYRTPLCHSPVFAGNGQEIKAKIPRAGKRPGAAQGWRPQTIKENTPQTPAKKRPLNKRQATYLKGIAEGKSKKDAALEAGYAPSSAKKPHRTIRPTRLHSHGLRRHHGERGHFLEARFWSTSRWPTVLPIRHPSKKSLTNHLYRKSASRRQLGRWPEIGFWEVSRLGRLL